MTTKTSECNLYFCPTVGEFECSTHGGFDTCCDHPELHQPITCGMLNNLLKL